MTMKKAINISLATIFLFLSTNAFAQAPRFSKSFSDGLINVGETTTLTFTIDNSNSVLDLENAIFRDDYPLGLQTAAPSNLSFNCSGGIGNNLTYIETNLYVNAGEVCTVSIDVTGVSAGLQVNTTSEMTSSLGNAGPAQASIVVKDAGSPAFTKSFGAAQIEVGEVTFLEFSIDNTANASAANNLTFIDVLPPGIQVATPDNLDSSCGGITGVLSNQVDLSGTSLAAGESCLISLDVVGVSPGIQENITIDLTSSAGNSGPAVSSIEVLATPVPVFNKSFADASIEVGGTTTLTFTIDNTSVVTDANGMAFDDVLPAGIEIAVPDNLSNSCGGVVNLTPGQLSFSGGSVTANNSCQISVDVEGTNAGIQNNITTNLTSSIGASNPATDQIIIRDSGTPGFTMSFAASVVGQNTPVALTFMIDNSAIGSDATNMNFSHTLPTDMAIAALPNVSNNCTGGTVTAISGSSVISYNSGTVGANQSCELSVDVVGLEPGIYVNITSDLVSSLGNSGPALANLEVLIAPDFSLNTQTNYMSVGGVTTITYLISHLDGDADANSLNLTHLLPGGLELATPANAAHTCDGGVLTAVDGSNVLTYTGGALMQGSLCNISVDIMATSLGVQNGSSDDLTSNLGNSGSVDLNIEVIDAIEWNVAGSASWFDGANWMPNQVPNSALNVKINNGGTSAVGLDDDDIAMLDFGVGVDGGSGFLTFADDTSSEIEVNGAFDIGVTAQGSSTSTGRVEFLGDSNSLFDFRSDPSTMRIGVTQTDGDADGTLVFLDSFISSSPQFDALMVGVSDGSGSAMGTLVAVDANTSSIQTENNPVMIGVANSSGDATAIFNGTEVQNVGSFDAGVSHGAGHANATVDLGFSFKGTTNGGLQGPANIGITNDTGSATAVVNQQLDIFGTVTASRFTELNVGIANGTGAANGTLRNSNGISIPVINVGLNPGGGTADGLIYVDHGLIDTTTLTLGAGSVLQLNANSTTRAGNGFSGTVYSAVNANTAVLAGELIIDVSFLLTSPATFEVVNTNSPTGITGVFSTVTVNNLPSGFVVSSGVQLDNLGNQQFVVNITGTPVLPEWDNVNTGVDAGDWFDGGNWSGGFVPLAVDPAIVNNGGEALADSQTAPGTVSPRDIIIGQDGGTGIFRSEGVDVVPGFSFLIAKVSPLISAEQTATGDVVINDANIIVPPNDSPSTSVFDPGSVLAVGFAQGGGTADASMVVNNGSIQVGDDVLIGAALPIAVDATPTADASFTFNGAGIDVSTIEADSGNGDVHIAFAQDSNSGPGASPTAIATANINNATINADINIAETDAFTDDAISQATANNVVLSNLFVTGDLDIADVGAFDPRVQVTATATATITDVTFGPDSGSFSIGNVNAGDPDAIGTSISTSTWTRVSITDSDSDFGVADVSANRSNTVATVDAEVTFIDSILSIDDLNVGDVYAQENGVGNLTATLNLEQNTTVTGQELVLGEYSINDTARATSTVNLNVTDSTISLGDETVLGETRGSSTNSATEIIIGMTMTNSSLVSPAVNIAESLSPAGSLSATLSLNSGYVDTDALDLGTDGTIVFGLNGANRATLANVGDTNTYSAIDASDATIAGNIVVDFISPPPGGFFTYDLIVTESATALDDFSATASVLNLPASVNVSFFGVAEDNGVDVLRLVVASPLAIDDAFTVAEDSVNQSFDVQLNDDNLAINGVIIEAVSTPTFGSVSIAAGNDALIYSAGPDFCTIDSSLDTFTYTISGGSVATVTVNVTCVNDAPSFNVLGDVVVNTFDVSNNPLLISDFAENITLGPANESGQQIEGFNITVQSDTNGILSGISLANDATLSVNFSGSFGTALVDVTLQDNGGTANNGFDTSAVQSFSVIHTDLIFANGFEQATVFKVVNYLVKVQEQSVLGQGPVYLDAYDAIEFNGEIYRLYQDHHSVQQVAALNSWLHEVLMFTEPFEDYDGDGTQNLFDPQPFSANK